MTTSTQAEPGTEVAQRPQQVLLPPAPVDLSSTVYDLDQLYRLCRVMATAGCLPKALVGKPADVFVIVLYGQELNLSPIQSVQGIYVVNGRPQIAGQTWLAKLVQAGHTYEIVHGDGKCTTTITRGDNGRTHTETFSAEDAKRAKLASKDTYLQYPKRMLMWRSVSDCASVICPDVALGFGIAEVASETAGPGAPVLAGVVGRRPDGTPAEMATAVNAEVLRQQEGGHVEPAGGPVADVSTSPVSSQAPDVVQPPADQADTYADIAREHEADGGDEGDEPRNHEPEQARSRDDLWAAEQADAETAAPTEKPRRSGSR